MNDSYQNRPTRNGEPMASNEPFERSSLPWITIPILIPVVLLTVLGLREFTGSQPATGESSEFESSPDASPSIEAKMTAGRATIAFNQQFCISLAKPVAKGGDIGFYGRWGYQEKKLLAPGGILPLGNGDLNEVWALPVHRRPRLSDLFTTPEGYVKEYVRHADLVVGQCYAVLCADRRSYAKIRVLDFPVDGNRHHNTLTFEWVYMSDGSRVFQE